MSKRRVLGGLAVAGLLSALVYAVLAVLTDADEMATALRTLSAMTVATMLALALANYAVRALRWQYLMRTVGHPVGIRDALYLQFSGLTMTVTPGKVGEVLKAYLARETVGMPMTRGVALVFVERLFDLVAVVVLSLGGISMLRSGRLALLVVGVLLVAGIAILSTEWFHERALGFLESRSWMRERHASARELSGTVRDTLAPLPLLIALVLSVVAWGLEGLAFWLGVQALGFTLAVLGAVGIYAISTVAGAVTFLPGGIGLTEASMAGLLIAAGMAPPDASAATLLIRVVTLWFGVALGWLALATRPSVVAGFFKSQEPPAEGAAP